MIRQDGTFKIFRIQHQSESGEWFFSNLDHFGYPDGLNASSECWQQTGVTGTFFKDVLLGGLKWLRRKHKGEYKFRGVLVTVTQKTTPI